MLAEVGHCPGIENYSRPLSGKPPGATPDTLYDFFPDDFITFVDESHVTVPQVRAMYAGDRSRKETLVDHGFRLAQCVGQSPAEIRGMGRTHRTNLFCQRDAERLRTAADRGEVVEQIIRPTGLFDPTVEVVSARGQVNHLLRRDPLARVSRRTCVGHGADQAIGRGSRHVLPGTKCSLPMAAQRIGCL